MIEGRGLARAAILGALVASALPPAPAGAHVHLVKIREVFVSASAQYVELEMVAPSQNVTTGTQIVVENAAGNPIATFTFETDVPNGAEGDAILVATEAAEEGFGVPADLVMPTASLSTGGGRVCFTDPAVFGQIDCVSWGDFAASPSGSGTPFNASEGIPAGASIERRRGPGDPYPGGDPGDLVDTNDSAADFTFGVPSPRNNSGAVGTAAGGMVGFDAAAFDVPEAAGSAQLTVRRRGGTGVMEISYATEDGTALAGSDYAPSQGTLSFPDADTTASFAVTILDDEVLEGPETVGLRLRSPTGGSVLAAPFDAILTIHDDEEPPDLTGPTTRIDRPRDGRRYRRARLTRFRGTSTDDVSGVQRVQIALQRRLVNGACRWWDGDGFARGRCRTKRWVDASGTDSWRYRLPGRLRRSVGTRTKHYVLFARGTDAAGNLERAFRRGRNVSVFEVV